MKKKINAAFALKLLKSGYSLNNVEVTDALDLNCLEVDRDIFEQITIQDSIIDEFASFGSTFQKKVVLKNSVFRYVTMLQGAHYYEGLEIENCTFENLVDLSIGGLNKESHAITIENNRFEKFVSFDDCIYDGPFIMRNNMFAEGTNILGDWQLSPVFEEPPIIENNIGELTLTDSPKPFADYYTRHTVRDGPVFLMAGQEALISPEEAGDLYYTEKDMDYFIRFVDTFALADKAILLESKLRQLKEMFTYKNDRKTKIYIDLLETIKTDEQLGEWL